MGLKAVFVDRDGVINEDYGYVYLWKDFRFKRNLKKGLFILQKLGYKLIIVTNQSGIARGYFTEDDYFKLTTQYLRELRKENIFIEEVFYCPHHPLFSSKYECKCRKPNPGMIKNAIDKYNIDAKQSVIIGDNISDTEAGYNCSIPSRYLISKKDIKHFSVTKIFKSLFDCAKYLENNLESKK